MLVYLAGPIEGLPYLDAVKWRQRAAGILRLEGVGTLDPMRGKQVLWGKTIESAELPQTSPQFTAEGIAYRDWHDVRRCDALIFNFLIGTGYGTVMELAWAWALGKPVSVARPLNWPAAKHPLLGPALGPYQFDTVDEAVKGVLDLLGGDSIRTNMRG